MRTPKLDTTMTKSLVCVRETFSMSLAHRLLVERGIRHLPVVGENGELIGILSDRDVQRAMDPDAPSFRGDSKVSEFMSWPVRTMDIRGTLRDVADAMVREKISALVVTREGYPCGIVTTEDMLRVLSSLLTEERESWSLADPRFAPFVQELIREAGAVGI